MPVTTIEDVAEWAGVSAATVDRVLHGRGKPREDTVARVKQAIEALGYRPNGAASVLARGQTRRIGLVIPDLKIGFLEDLSEQAERLAGELESAGAALHILRCDEADPFTYAKRFEAFAGGMEACAMLGPNDPAVIEAVARLEQKGVRIATIVSELSTSVRSLFVGPNNRHLGATAASLLAPVLERDEGCVVVFKPAVLHEDHEARYVGFCNALQSAGIDMGRIKTFVAPFEETEEALATRAVAELEAVPISCAYMTGGGLGAQVTALRACQKGPTVAVATDLTALSRELLLAQDLNFVVAYDVKDLLRTASLSLLRKLGEPQWEPKSGFQQVEVFTRFNLPQPS